MSFAFRYWLVNEVIFCHSLGCVSGKRETGSGGPIIAHAHLHGVRDGLDGAGRDTSRTA